MFCLFLSKKIYKIINDLLENQEKMFLSIFTTYSSLNIKLNLFSSIPMLHFAEKIHINADDNPYKCYFLT